MESVTLKKFFLAQDLWKLIKCVRNIALITTWGEVIEGLKEYIVQKKLYDHDQMKIVCHNDDLEQLFGVSEFEIPDIKDLLKSLVFPIRGGIGDSAEVPISIPTVSDETLKRKHEEVSDEIKPKRTLEGDSAETSQTFSGECSFVRPDTSPMILHIPPSPKIESESEVDSVQCYETSVVKDTSDESVYFDESDNGHRGFEGIITVAETFELEYEPLSEDSSEKPSEGESDTDSGSDFDFINSLNSIITFVSKSDSDQEYLADMSSDEDGGSDTSLSYGFDAEISEEDLWKCSRCSSINNPPNRFCSKCFSTRQGWLANEKTPERRKRRKPRTKRKKRKDKRKDPPLSSSANSNSLGLPCTSKKESDREDDSEILFSQSTNESSDAKLCLLCCSKPVNSSIIHGKFAHSISCFGCARRLQLKKRRCPICRRTIERVVYQISA